MKKQTHKVGKRKQARTYTDVGLQFFDASRVLRRLSLPRNNEGDMIQIGFFLEGPLLPNQLLLLLFQLFQLFVDVLDAHKFLSVFLAIGGEERTGARCGLLKLFFVCFERLNETIVVTVVQKDAVHLRKAHDDRKACLISIHFDC